jgi:hypothetical protein
MRQKELVLVSHDTYVRVKKIPALLAGQSVDAWDDFWAFYQSSIRKQAVEKNSTYAAELRLAPLKTWRASHLHNLAAVFERRGNRTYAQDMRDLVKTLELPAHAVVRSPLASFAMLCSIDPSRSAHTSAIIRDSRQSRRTLRPATTSRPPSLHRQRPEDLSRSVGPNGPQLKLA